MKIDQLEPEAGKVQAASSTTKKKGFWALNWLRFLVAIYLVLFHTLRLNYSEVSESWLRDALSLGNWGTSVFFVLSGFLLTHAYVVMQNGRKLDSQKFLLARFSTLYPLHVVGMLLALIPVAMTIRANGGIAVPTEISGTATRMLADAELFVTLLMNMLLLSAWNPFYLAVNAPSWSLSALAFFYLVFPLAAPKIYRMKALVPALIIFGILFALPGAIADLLHRTDIVTDGLLHRNPIIRVPLFLAGMVLCVLYSRRTTATPRWMLAIMWMTVIGTAVFAVELQANDYRLHIVRNGLFYPGSLAVIWLCVSVNPSVSDRVRYWGDRLGAAALPLFLLHLPTFAMFQKTEKFLTAAAASPHWNMGLILGIARETKLSLVFYPLYIISLVILCVFVQERFVAPLQKKIRGMRRPQVPGPNVETVRTGTD